MVDTARSWAERLRAPEARRLFVPFALGIIGLIALELRLLFDIEGVLDIDAVNFGLAGLEFDVLHAQPHPPGYPGYVLLLKLVHLIAPSLDPLEIAKWTTRICGVAGVLAAYWACVGLLALDPARAAKDAPLLRPLAAALLAAVHPLLWYYGSDGQSHAAEATGTLLLVGAAARAVRVPTVARALLLATAFAIAGSLRPTLPLLLAPILLWVFWRQPLRVWVLGALLGGGIVLAYLLPTVAAAGGWDLYRRATRALVSELFVANYSPFGARASWAFVQVNLNLVLVGSVLALLPALAWCRAPSEAPASARVWRRLFGLCALLTIAFYALLFVRELGYFAGLAGLAVLVPASWPARVHLARPLLVLFGLPALALFGPATIPAPFSPGRGIELPTLRHVVQFEKALRYYRDSTCRHTSPRGTLVLSDSLVATHTRVLPHLCPGVVAGVLILHPPLNPALDNWVFYTDRTMLSVPTPIPLELGPPATLTLPYPVDRVVVGQDSSRALLRAIEASAICAPLAGPSWPEAPAVWPVRCVPELRVGRNRIRILAAP